MLTRKPGLFDATAPFGEDESETRARPPLEPAIAEPPDGAERVPGGQPTLAPDGAIEPRKDEKPAGRKRVFISREFLDEFVDHAAYLYPKARSLAAAINFGMRQMPDNWEAQHRGDDIHIVRKARAHNAIDLYFKERAQAALRSSLRRRARPNRGRLRQAHLVAISGLGFVATRLWA